MFQCIFVLKCFQFSWQRVLFCDGFVIESTFADIATGDRKIIPAVPGRFTCNLTFSKEKDIKVGCGCNMKISWTKFTAEIDI